MSRFITFIVHASLGFLKKMILLPQRFFVNKSEMLEINRRLDSIGSL
jgi:hypothetical protein